jgi:hypothetical protein
MAALGAVIPVIWCRLTARTSRVGHTWGMLHRTSAVSNGSPRTTESLV